MRKIKFYLMLVFVISAFVSIAQVPFTAGNIVVYRIGDGTSAVDGFSTYKVFLDEYTPTGTLVQSIAMPTTGDMLTQPSTVTTGYLNLSADGKYLLLGGYNAPPGTDWANTPNIQTTIGRVDYSGIVNTSTHLTDNPGIINSVASDNGTNVWFASSQGIRYTTIGSSTATDLALNGTRAINITNGQLYVSTSSSSTSISTVGSGLPTTTGQTLAHLPGTGAAQQFVFADMDATVPGVDVLYAVISAGIAKYSLVAGTWTQMGIVGPSGSYRGLTAKISGTSVTLFATAIGSNNSTNLGGQLVSLTDNSGYNATLTGTPTVIATASVTPDFASFKGVALVPQAPSVKVAIKTFLQGAYNSGLGRHKDVTSAWAGILNANALSQPYNTAAFNSYAGTESVSSGFFTSTGATTDILDWVLVELRNSATPATVVARRAAFIREDGQIVDLDGTSDVSFPGVTAGNYYVVVRHRNHLPIRSSSAIALSSTATLYDFSAQQSNAYQDGAITTNAAMKDVSGSGTVFAMWGGNANSNTKVSFTGVNNDAGSILGALGGNQGLVSSSVYNFADLNLDGSVKYTGTNNDSGLLLSVLGSNQAAVYTQHQ